MGIRIPRRRLIFAMAAPADITSLRAAARDSWIRAAIPVSVDAVVEKASKDGKPYLEVQLCDALDRFALRVWWDNGQ